MRKYLFSKKYMRRCVIRTLVLSILASCTVIASARIFIFDKLYEEPAHAAEIQAEPQVQQPSYVAITFDDSPSEYTDDIVDLLDYLDVKATFFVMGINIAGYEESIAHICLSGHDIANHGWDHSSLTVKTPAGVVDSFSKTEDLIKTICGRATPLVRPAYNALTEGGYQALYGASYRIIYYDIDSDDFFNRSEDSIMDKIAAAKAGDIIRFHDGRITPVILEKVIKCLRSMGLEPVSVSTLLTD